LADVVLCYLGAGKTTCLDILASRLKRGLVSGEIMVNGRIPTRSQFKKISGYVDQEDSMLGTLTVYETVLFSAQLRLPKTMRYLSFLQLCSSITSSYSQMAIEKRVEDTLVELGIDHIANHRIGSPGQRGISGGEKRRVSIAMELVTSPSILYLDEPTSGLDR
jgi:ABC-type multidrug transport system ATPase subunit